MIKNYFFGKAKNELLTKGTSKDVLRKLTSDNGFLDTILYKCSSKLGNKFQLQVMNISELEKK